MTPDEGARPGRESPETVRLGDRYLREAAQLHGDALSAYWEEDARVEDQARTRALSARRRTRELLQEDEIRHFAGLSHAEALAREVPARRQLVAGLIETATVGTIAALPGTFKSFLAVEIVHKIAAGGRVLGLHEVIQTGPVGFWWQDDSEANELTRLQQYARLHGYTGNLPIRWYLNQNLTLPDDLAALQAEIEREGQVLVGLDSLYNFVPGLDLKDEEVAGIIAMVKTEICDRTGCTVMIVDHAPWPTESNRGQRRAYGSVFKAAAIRWGLHLYRTKDSIWIEGWGNNLPGLTRTLLTFDAKRLELRPVKTERPDEDERYQRVIAYVEEHPGEATYCVENGAGGNRECTRDALDRAARSGRVLWITGEAARRLGRDPRGKYWYPVGHKDLQSLGEIGATAGESRAELSQEEMSPVSPAPEGGARDGATS